MPDGAFDDGQNTFQDYSTLLKLPPRGDPSLNSVSLETLKNH